MQPKWRNSPQKPGGCGHRQLGGDSRYGLNCRLANLQEKNKEKTAGGNPSGERINIKH